MLGHGLALGWLPGLGVRHRGRRFGQRGLELGVDLEGSDGLLLGNPLVFRVAHSESFSVTRCEK
jgi:hypothetical protein